MNYTADEVTAIAKNLYPECRIQEIDPACNCRKDDYTFANPEYSATYLGYGVWEVDKLCSINSTWNRSWYFYEDTGEFVVRSINYSENTTAPLSDTSTPSRDIENGLEIGIYAPDFTLNGLDGKPVILSDYRGKIIMLDFWTFSCSNCRQKLSIVQDYFNNNAPQEKLAIFCINVQGNDALIQSYIYSQKLTVPILMDIDGIVSKLYQVNSFPSILIIATDARIYQKNVEFSSLAELTNIINSLLDTL